MTKRELLKKIRLNCIDCMGGQFLEVAGCTSPKCQFFELRFGKDPRPCSRRVDNLRKTTCADERNGQESKII